MGGPIHPRISRVLSVGAVIFGLLLTSDLLVRPERRMFGKNFLMFLGPVIVTGGVLWFFSTIDWAAYLKDPDAPRSSASPPTAPIPKPTQPDDNQTLLYFGVVLVAIPAVFLVITPFAGNLREITAFMGGTALFFLGLPGLAITLFAAVRGKKRKPRG